MARLRIIAGEFGGRLINADVGQVTHPMGDRVRSALFASLSSRDKLANAQVLDAFAGTGSIGLEALSRGARSATFIERDHQAVKVLRSNVASLAVEDRSAIINTTVANWVKNRRTSDMYDLIFADPPYHHPQFSTVYSLLEALKTNGLMILSCQGRLCVPNPNEGVVVVDNFRSYGEATLTVFHKVSANSDTTSRLAG